MFGSTPGPPSCFTLVCTPVTSTFVMPLLVVCLFELCQKAISERPMALLVWDTDQEMLFPFLIGDTVDSRGVRACRMIVKAPQLTMAWS
jgi:hypothetical protein